MTKPRQPSSSHELCVLSSSKPRYKHQWKTRRGDAYDDEYSDASLSEPLYQSNENDEEQYERTVKDEDEDASYMGSESETNAPSDRFSSEPVSPSLDNAKGLSKSVYDSPNNFLSQPDGIRFAWYMNIAPLPIFRGALNECPVLHLSRFTKVCRANNASAIDMMMRIFPVTLEDEAALWYDLNIEPYLASLAWEDIKSSFLRAYQKIELVDHLRSELMIINQGEEETVRSYFLRLQWILKQWPDHGLRDGLLKGLFVDGLREDFRDWMIPQKPASLTEALRLAFEYEQVQSIRPAAKRVSKCGFCDGVHEERACQVRERMRELWRKSKEKEDAVSLGKSNGNDEVGKELVRSVSMGASSGVGKSEEDDGKVGGFVSGKKGQCQCWKHECWRKSLGRNSSLLTTRISNAE